jgi:hypothetical protein
VSIVGSRENDSWDLKILGPNGFGRSYTLAGNEGEHQPFVIGNVLLRLLPAKMPLGVGLSPRRRRESANGLSDVDRRTKVCRTSLEERRVEYDKITTKDDDGERGT